MRYRIFVVFLVLFMILMLGLSADLALAETAPFSPAQPLYGLQLWAEQSLLKLNPDPVSRAAFTLDLVQRRISDLRDAAGSAGEIEALGRIDQVLNDTAMELAPLAPQDTAQLRQRTVTLLNDLQSVMASLSVAPKQAAKIFGEVQLKTTSFLITLSDPAQPLSALPGQLDPAIMAAIAQPVATTTRGPEATATAIPPQAVDPHIVAFQAGSGGAAHAFWPLSGAHQTADCQACHTQGRYAGTPTQCAACHAKNVPPVGHPFPTTCDLCHNTQDWKQVSFSHSVMDTTNCQSCHNVDKPANHFPGQCSACHTTNAWIPATFDHAVAQATDCLSCHIPDRPANHWQAQCSACHNTSGWLPAHFNHAAAGATDCQNCHQKDAPANHWQAQCSACHNTNAWKPASFNHAAVGATDCQSCHARPANHWQAQCSACHSTNAWKPAHFNHAAVGATDCQSCHTPPANHFAGQCSQCHNTSTWAGATFNHSFPLNHGGANGNCAKCHPSGTGPSYTCFTCHNQGQMDQKHANIQGYSPSACAKCHPSGRGD
jgi:hypothetical protein